MLITLLTLTLELQNVVLDIAQHQLRRKIMMTIQQQLLMVQYLRRLRPLRLVQPPIWLQIKGLLLILRLCLSEVSVVRT